MKINKFINLIGLILMAMTFTMCKAQQSSVPSTPQEALAELIVKEAYYDVNTGKVTID